MDKDKGVELGELDGTKYEDQNAMVRLIVKGRENWGIMDTAARYIWVYELWFKAIGGSIVDDEAGADADNGSYLEVTGKGELSFSLWGCPFKEEVRVMRKLSSNILIGIRFW